MMAYAKKQHLHQLNVWLVVKKYPTGSRFTRMLANPSIESHAARRPPTPITWRAKIWNA